MKVGKEKKDNLEYRGGRRKRIIKREGRTKKKDGEEGENHATFSPETRNYFMFPGHHVSVPQIVFHRTQMYGEERVWDTKYVPKGH